MAKQLGLFEAEQAAVDGMTRAVDHANRKSPDWEAYAFLFLMRYARLRNEPFLIEDAREWAYSQGLDLPPDGRAWGAVTRFAATRHHLVRCGTGNARSSNNSPKVLWALPNE
jgi:hypothetical protein